jgi:hypothetical protein
MRSLGVLLLLTVLSGCGSSPALQLPTASAVIGSTTISLPRGSYCWSSGGQATCADSASPDVLLKTRYLKPVSEPGGANVRVRFSGQAHGIAVEFLWTASGRKPGPVPYDESGFNLPVDPDRYVIAITGYFQEGNVGFFLPVDVTR